MKYLKKIGVALLSIFLICPNISVSATELVSENDMEDAIFMDIEQDTDLDESLLETTETVGSASATCVNDLGINSETQNYNTYATTMKTFLQTTSDGKIMMVRANTYQSSGYLTVAYYNSSYQFLSAKQITQELPIFGSFYCDGNYYYIVSGQTNPNENDSVEVYRITKYDTNWNRIGSCGLYGANTYIPFDAGSCRLTHTGNYLIVRTCHEMYKSSDGYHHQASVTIDVNTSTMTVVGSTYSVSNCYHGYISHSFNQFVKIDGGKIVALDHGDAHPRSIVLLKYTAPITSGSFSSSTNTQDIFSFEGAEGNNITGASLGGFEISDNYYLIAGASVPENTEEQNLSSLKRNIFLYAVNKSTNTITKNWATNDAAINGSYNTPHLISTGSGYMLLFSRENMVYYASVGANGSVGTIYSMNGNLSDCKPIVQNGKVIWCVTNSSKVTFYEIQLSNLSKNNSYTIEADHSYIQTSNDGSTIQLKCSKCGETKSIRAITSARLYIGTDGSSYSTVSSYQNKNVTLYGWIYGTNTSSVEWEVTSSNPEVVSLEMTSSNKFKMYTKKCGTAKISIKQKYNDSLSLSKTFYIKHDTSDLVYHAAVAATESSNGCKEYWTCNSCGGCFSDSAGKYSTTMEELTIPALSNTSGGSDNGGNTGGNDNNNTGNTGGNDNNNTGNTGGNDTNNTGDTGGNDNNNTGNTGGNDTNNNTGNTSGNDNNSTGNTDSNDNSNTNTNSGKTKIGTFFAYYNGYDFFIDVNGSVRCYNAAGNIVINDFKCDGTYTYYFQADGTAMRDRLTYHPDGVHVIYFDSMGHEVFSDFANVKKNIQGNPVDDMCFFNTFGYMYVDTLTYDKTGTKLYYINPYGVLERNGWFEFSGNEFDAGLGFSGRSGGYGYAYSDCSLLTNKTVIDWLGRFGYLQGDGHLFIY